MSAFLGISERRVRRMKPELTACGAVFFMKLGQKKQKTACWWPSEIRKWCRIKGSKGEII